MAVLDRSDKLDCLGFVEKNWDLPKCSSFLYETSTACDLVLTASHCVPMTTFPSLKQS